mmetsp:Transcript_27131/g.63183  ORF Transcript_27131/g.63183 Transcript_27131/m.63183 type:complete len:88 (-) Transcript_27131:118-381(-)
MGDSPGLWARELAATEGKEARELEDGVEGNGRSGNMRRRRGRSVGATPSGAAGGGSAAFRAWLGDCSQSDTSDCTSDSGLQLLLFSL